MKSILKAFILAFLFVGCTDTGQLNIPTPEKKQTQLDFTKIGDFPGPGRTRAFSFPIGNKIYIGTGAGSNASYLGDFWEYDIDTKCWTEKAAFPLGPFFGGEAVVFNGKGYVFFGGIINCPEFNSPCNHIDYSEVHAYDPKIDKWEKVADLNPIRGILGGIAILEGDKAIFFWDRKTYEISMVDFQIVQKPEPPTSIIWASHFRLGNKVYFTCGMENGKGTKNSISYDLTSGQWEKLPDFPGTKRYGGVGFAHDGYGYIIGGKESDFFGEDEQFKEIWQFDPSYKSWEKIGEYPGSAFTGKILEVVGNDIYLGFGDNRNWITYEKDWWMLKLK